MTLYQRIDSRIIKDDCWIYCGTLDKVGYARLRDNDGNKKYVHRIMYERYKGPIPEDTPHIMHTCDNPPCCNPEHLIAATHYQNMQDMKAKGRAARQLGESHGMSKLTWATVNLIRSNTTNSHTEIAALYCISPTTVRDILGYKTWKNPPAAIEE